MKRSIIRFFSAAVAAAVFSVTAYAERLLIPVGKVVGLSLSEGSVTVVAFDDACGENARQAGLEIGDDIRAVDGENVDSASDLRRALQHSDGSVKLTVCREGKERQLKLSPAVTADGPKLGVFIREGVTGIGTVTYYDPERGSFGALGHGVSDARGKLCAMRTGTLYRATVASVKPGQAGKPGQLRGSVSAQQAFGTLDANTSRGVFGKCQAFSGEALPVAEADEVKPGPAQILSNISGDAVETFCVQILKVNDPEHTGGRDMVLQVTDPALLEATGGIVAGMSGSPIIQDGHLVGAVTHVLVNDPTTGYGIFIENMLDVAS